MAPPDPRGGGQGDDRTGRSAGSSEWKASARPRQVGRVDAGPEKVLRAPKATDRGVQLLPEFDQVIRTTVGECPVSLSPDVLRRIEFGYVRREVTGEFAEEDLALFLGRLGKLIGPLNDESPDALVGDSLGDWRSRLRLPIAMGRV
jgi:hypothetical protein